MVPTNELILGVAAPFAAAFIVTLLGARRWPRASVGAALALAYIGAHLALSGAPRFTPAPVEQWFPFVALGALIIGAVESRECWALWARVLWRAAAVGGSTWLVVRVKAINGQWTPAEAGAWTAAFAVAALALWFLSDVLVARLGRPAGRAWHSALPLSGGIGLGALLIVLDGHSLTLGQLTGALAVALLGAGAASFVTRTAAFAPAGTAVTSLLAPTLWLTAALWTDLHWWYALAIALSPVAALAVASVPRVRSRRPWARSLLATLGASLPLVPLVGWELKQAYDEQQAASELGY